MSFGNALSFNNTDSPVATCRPTVLVVSPPALKDHLKDALLVENTHQYSDKLQFVFCEDVEDILPWTPDIHTLLEYVIIVLDPRDSTCIQVAENNIRKLGSKYKEGGRLCVVNGACKVRPTHMGVPHGSINIMSQKYSLMLINGDVWEPEKCLYLASKLLRLISVVVGLQSGVALSVDIPGYLPSSFR